MVRNSEILFVYEAKHCNPNGDPDNENKPRMDWGSSKNLVSDVRLKRYIRDYLYHAKGKDIFVRKENDQHVDATQRVNTLSQQLNKKNLTLSDYLNAWIDVRLFGATIPIKGQGNKGQSIAITGPVQFTWGYSFNKVEILDSSSITSVFSGAKEGGGTIGKDWRVKYSLIGFYGRINRHFAEKSALSEDDIKLLDEAIWKSIPIIGNTHTKIGQEPKVYIRVEYKDDTDFVIGDLRKYFKVGKDENVEDFNGANPDIGELLEVLGRYKDKIHKVYYRFSEDAKVLFGELRIPGVEVEELRDS